MGARARIRGGTFHYRNLMEGAPGTIDNFQPLMGRNDKDFVSPRHRHNFEQFRFQLEGDLDFDRDGKMTPGMLGYFRGRVLRPADQRGDGDDDRAAVRRPERQRLSRVLRSTRAWPNCASPARSRPASTSASLMRPASATWTASRRFGSTCTAGRCNSLGLRYAQPIMMNQAHYDWVASSEHQGVHEKLLGVFTERRAEARLLKLAPGSALSGKAAASISGCGPARAASMASRCGRSRRCSSTAATASFTADTDTEILHFGLPDLRGMSMPQPALQLAVAAEKSAFSPSWPGLSRSSRLGEGRCPIWGCAGQARA